MKTRTPNYIDLMSLFSLIESGLQAQGGASGGPPRPEVAMGLDALRSLQEAAKGFFSGNAAPGTGPVARNLAFDEIARQPRLNRQFSPKPVFIIGYRRSGTTLLAYLLDSHPNLACVPETPVCQSMFGLASGRLPKLLETGSLLRWSLGEPREVFFGRCAQLVSDVFAGYAARNRKTRWVSKELFVANSIDLLDMAFDYQAQFVYIVRHGLDAAFSASEKFELLDAPAMKSGFGLANYLDEWRATNEALRSFQARNKRRCLRVRFEDFLRDPNSIAKDIFAFLGEPWVPTILEDMQNQEHPSLGDSKIHETGGRVDPSRRDRWLAWPGELLEELAPVADPMLKQLGYRPVLAGLERRAAAAD